MSVPPPVGLVHYDEPRAVQVRNPENLKDIHSAVHGALAIYTDNKQETDALLERWSEIMAAADNEARRILGLI